MCDSNDDDMTRLSRVDDAEWKTAHQDTTEIIVHGGAELRVLSDRVDRMLYVVEKIGTEPGAGGFVEKRRLDHLFLDGRKQTIGNHRSRLRARAIASSPGVACISPRR